LALVNQAKIVVEVVENYQTYAHSTYNIEMAINWILERVEESISTNEDLMSRWRTNNLLDPVARLAQKQTAGKGRMGRSWVSSPNQTLTFSIAYPFKKSIQELSGLSLAIGLAVIKGISHATHIPLEELHQRDLGLKWPNDVLLKNNKLAGVLIEGGQLKPGDPTWLIIGVGINLNKSPDLEHQLGRKVSCLDDIVDSQVLNSDIIWLEMLKELGLVIEEFEKSSFQTFQNLWNHWDSYQNKVCQIHQEDQLQLEGIEKGVDENGVLLIETSAGIKKVVSGDVSLRVIA
jgi:BirA family biotin operon repressor/biotin-[acetyl-CoA-carboxylase] ligase